MNAATVLAIVQLVGALTPAAITLINNLVNAAQGSGEKPEDIIKKIEEISATLKPMNLK